MKVAIMAGGIGSRLKPMTLVIPKPLIPIGGKPILEIIIKSLKKNGFDDIILCVGYKSDLIKTYFGSGSNLKVRLRYLKEKKRLGTAGPLRLVRDFFGIKEPILMLNGDILTNINYRKMCKFHKKNKGDITIGIKEKEIKTKYGVIQTDGNMIKGVKEKPSFKFKISAGINIINPEILRYIKPNRYFDMPELINRCIKEKRNVLCYNIKEYWQAIDRMEDYNQANKKVSLSRNFLRGVLGR
ncbi:MAG: NTP transferase domain-containing protein [Nanoarchaeota archaeon]|nr:NTP transferase domain-containing protein [Nanoarchaeota archaeon]MBU1005608.1 NTP transferase domain-containing protein [Nanoarchaeota archaeon]MBU1945994.1 NTP transferase domain-containing protein [Nanoarchaeota archaeon]